MENKTCSELIKRNMKTTFKNPIDCYNSIKEIEYDMELSIHDLVWKYGKRKETKKYGVTYELSTYDHKKHVYPLVCDCKGVYREIKKVIIRNPEQCQRMGHVWIVDSNGKVYSFLAFPHQQFSIYSAIYAKTIKE